MGKQQLNSVAFVLLVIPLLSLKPGDDRDTATLKKLRQSNDVIRTEIREIEDDNKRIDFYCQQLQNKNTHQKNTTYEFIEFFKRSLPDNDSFTGSFIWQIYP